MSLIVLCLFGEQAQVIQVEWQALSAFGGIVGGSLVAAAKIVAGQLAKNSSAQDKRHEENRSDAKEAREENRNLFRSVLTLQGESIQGMAALQTEVRAVLERLGACEEGSKNHAPLPPGGPKKK